MSLALTLVRVKVSTRSRAVMSTLVTSLPITAFAFWVPVFIVNSFDSPSRTTIERGLYLGLAAVYLIANLVLTTPPLLFIRHRRPKRDIIIVKNGFGNPTHALSDSTNEFINLWM